MRRKNDRRAYRPAFLIAAPDALERRDVPAIFINPLGINQPSLSLGATAAPIATYGGNLGLELTVTNTAAIDVPEPLALLTGATSTAQSPATTVNVYISNRPRFGNGAVLLGTVAIPAVPANGVQIVDTTITLPPVRPVGYPGSGGNVYLYFKLDPSNGTRNINRVHASTNVGLPVQIAAPLPDLQAIALDLPPTLQPGDVVLPRIKVANYGTTDTSLQGPVTVLLVASTTPDFGPGSAILARFSVADIAPLSVVPSSDVVLGDVNLNDPANVVTLTGTPTTLPAGTSNYYVGVVVDPLNTIREIREIGTVPSSALFPVRFVGGPIRNLPPAGVLTSTASSSNSFPTPAFGILDTPQTRDVAGTASGTLTATTSPAATFALFRPVPFRGPLTTNSPPVVVTRGRTTVVRDGLRRGLAASQG